SIREMMRMAAWQYQDHEREKALRHAAELDYEEADKQTRTAPEIRKRREAELKKEAASRELHGDEPLKWFDYALPELNGNARIYHRGISTEKVDLTLPSGFYAYLLIDRGKGTTHQAPFRVDGRLHEIRFTSPVNSGELRITDERNTTATVP